MKKGVFGYEYYSIGMVSFVFMFNRHIDFSNIAKTNAGYYFSGNSNRTTFFVTLEYGFNALVQFIQIKYRE